MNKKLFAAVFISIFVLLVFSSFSSAYYYSPYYSGDNYDRYSYYSSRTSGSYGYYTTRSTNYDRTTERYWNGYAWVDRTTYVRETRETPYYGSRYYNYQPYGYYNYYQPWYQKYWRTPDYGYGNYNYGYNNMRMMGYGY